MRISGTVSTMFRSFGKGFRVLTAAVVLAAAGNVHGGQEPASSIPIAVGQYILASANSQALPALVSANGSRRQEVIGGSVTLNADGTHMWRTVYRYSGGGSFEDSESSGQGNYSQEGTRIIFLSEADTLIFEGTLEGNTLTIPVDVTMVYRKIFRQSAVSRASDQAITEPRGAGLAPPPPPPSTIGVFTSGLTLALGDVPLSFEGLCDSSELIVEAHVQSLLTPTRNLRYLETDAILSLDRVLKGPESIRQVVISQKGGVLPQFRQLPYQYNLMQPGEHYILFLTEEMETHLPDVPGIPRYALNGSWTGMVQIDESGVHMSFDTARIIREQFDGGSSQELVAAIQRCSQTPLR